MMVYSLILNASIFVNCIDSVEASTVQHMDKTTISNENSETTSDDQDSITKDSITPTDCTDNAAANVVNLKNNNSGGKDCPAISNNDIIFMIEKRGYLFSLLILAPIVLNVVVGIVTKRVASKVARKVTTKVLNDNNPTIFQKWNRFIFFILFILAEFLVVFLVSLGFSFLIGFYNLLWMFLPGVLLFVITCLLDMVYLDKNLHVYIMFGYIVHIIILAFIYKLISKYMDIYLLIIQIFTIICFCTFCSISFLYIKTALETSP